MRDRGQDRGNGERKGGRGSSRRTLEGEMGGGLKEKDVAWKDAKRGGGGGGLREQGAGITNESSLLFSQLFFSAP